MRLNLDSLRSAYGRVARTAWGSVAAIKNSVVSEKRRYVKARWGPARGATLYTSYRHGSRLVFGLYESEVMPYLRRYVRSGDVCYDIGAADGYYGFAFARLAAPGRVYCFDLDQETVEQLTTLATYNAHLGSILTAHRIRIGATHLDDTHTSIDTLVYGRSWQPPRVMKLDVEGDELDALHGAARVLREHHPKLMIEVHSERLEADCRDLLRNLGYDVTLVTKRALMAEGAFRKGHNQWLCAQ